MRDYPLAPSKELSKVILQINITMSLKIKAQQWMAYCFKNVFWPKQFLIVIIAYKMHLQNTPRHEFRSFYSFEIGNFCIIKMMFDKVAICCVYNE